MGRPRHRWMNNIKMDLGEVRGVMWTGLGCLRMGTGGIELSGYIKCWETIEWPNI
jgi:hypothetical protein